MPLLGLPATRCPVAVGQQPLADLQFASGGGDVLYPHFALSPDEFFAKHLFRLEDFNEVADRLFRNHVLTAGIHIYCSESVLGVRVNGEMALREQYEDGSPMGLELLGLYAEHRSARALDGFDRVAFQPLCIF